MTSDTQIALLIAVGAALIGGITLSANAGPVSASGAAKVQNASLRRWATDIYRPGADDGDWQAPKWSVTGGNGEMLRANHSLYRRPQFPGECFNKLQCGDWGSWYYDPPSEAYF